MYKVETDAQRTELTQKGKVICTVKLKDGTEIDVSEHKLTGMSAINQSDVIIESSDV